MPKLRNLSGKDLINFFEKQGFIVYRQKGSHVILTRKIEGYSQHLVIPNHDKLDRGMTYGIFKQSKEYLPEKELRNYFYSE